MAIAGAAAMAFAVLGAAVAAANLRPIVLGALSHAIGGQARVEGALRLTPSLAGVALSFERLRLRARGARSDFAMVERGEVDLPWSVLLGARGAREARLEGVRLNLTRDAAGRSNWPERRGGGTGATPRVDRLTVKDGRLGLDDQLQQRSFQGVFSTTAGAAPQLVVAGQGRAISGAFTLRLQTPASLSGTAARPLSLDLAIAGEDGRSTLGLQGELTSGRRGALRGMVRAAGPDLHDLAPVSGFSLPRTPPYALQTRVEANGAAVAFTALAGRMGASRIEGVIKVYPRPGGRRIEGDLRAPSLHLPDLLDVASSGQLTRGPRRPGRLLPDGPIRAAPLRKLTGAIRLAADHTDTPAVRRLQMTVRFDRGRVVIDPLRLQLASGVAANRFVLDARGDTPVIALDAELRGATTAEFVRDPAALPFSARFDASLRLKGTGPSFAAAATAADGRIRLRAAEGRLASVQASVLSADYAGGLGGLLERGRRSEVALRCALFDAPVRGGLGRVAALKIVTDAGGVTGSGGLNLRDATLDLVLRPATSGLRLTAVRLSGPLLHPRPDLQIAADPPRLVGAVIKAVAAAPGRIARGPAAEPGRRLTCP